MTSDLEKLDSFTLETSKNHLIRNFLRNGRVRVNSVKFGIFFLTTVGITSHKLSYVTRLRFCFSNSSLVTNVLLLFTVNRSETSTIDIIEDNFYHVRHVFKTRNRNKF